MKVITCEQRSPGWYSARLGVPTASTFSNIIDSKGNTSKSQTKLLHKLAGEKVSGVVEEGYKNKHMERGIELEAEAKSMYSLITGNEIEEVGFCLDDSDLFGCSPDGFINADGLIEIKCPCLTTHVEYLIKNRLPVEYVQQVQGQMLITGRLWCDCMSYYPSMKPLIVRVERDEEYLNCLRSALQTFCEELEEIINKIK